MGERKGEERERMKDAKWQLKVEENRRTVHSKFNIRHLVLSGIIRDHKSPSALPPSRCAESRQWTEQEYQRLMCIYFIR